MRLAIALLMSGALVTSGATPAAHAQSDTGDWPRYARDLAGTRYSPLKQINTRNVTKLEQAWSFRVRPEGGGAIVGSATPIVVGNLLYLPLGNAVVALEGDTGKEVWRHPVKGGLARRAVSYWPGDKAHAPRIYYSNGPSLFARREDRPAGDELRQGRRACARRAL